MWGKSRLGGAVGTLGQVSACAALAVVLLCLPTVEAHAQSDARVALPGHVPSALARATPVNAGVTRSKSAAVARVGLTIVLRRSDQASFDRYLADVYDANSTNFRKFLTPVQIAERFGPSQQDYDAVANFFAQQGFDLVETSANRMTLMVRADRATVDSALSVKLADYQIGDRRFVANDRDPSLPADIAARVEAVIGLSTLATPATKAQPMLDLLPNNNVGQFAWYALCLNYAFNGGFSAGTGLLAVFEVIFLEEVAILNFINNLYT